MTHRLFPLAAATLCAAFLMTSPVRAQNTSDKEPPTIAAQGEGKVYVKPDVARLEIGVETVDKDVSAAVQANASRMDAVLKAVKDLGVAEDDIRTVNYALFPRYNPPKPPSEQPVLVGYQVVNSVEVTVRKIGDAGRILDTATRAGANQAGGISFGLSEAEQQKAYAAALAKAVKDARQKIGSIARAADASNLTLYRIVEGGGGEAVPPRPMFAGRVMADAAPTPISGGQLTVTATVTMKYTFAAGTPL